MIKKIILSIFLLAIFLVCGGYFARNMVLKYYIASETSKIIDKNIIIEEVNFNPFKRLVEISNINILDNNDENTVLASIENIRIDYLLSLSAKEIEITNASVFGAKLINNTNPDITGEAAQIAEPVNNNLVPVDNLQPNIKTLINDQLDDLLSIQYGLVNEMLKLNEEEVKKGLDQIVGSQEFEEAQKNIVEILNSGNPFVLFEKNTDDLHQMKSSIRNLADSFKRERVKADSLLKDYDFNFEKSVNDAFESYISLGKGGIKNFDLLLNEYLNLEYEPQINQGVLVYENFILKLKYLKADESSTKNNWKFDIKSLLLTLNAYGMDFNGEISGISNKFHEDLDNVIFRLVAIEAPGERSTTVASLNNGVIDGQFNINDLSGHIFVNIPNGKLNNFDSAQNYMNESSFGLNASIILTNENIYITGTGDVHNMRLAPEVLNGKLKLDLFLLDETFLSLVEEISIDNAQYSYDSTIRKIEVITDLGQRILEQLESNDNRLEKEILKKLGDFSREKIESYNRLIEEDKNSSRMKFEEILDLKSKDIEKMNEVLDKIRTNDKKGVLDRFLERLD